MYLSLQRCCTPFYRLSSCGCCVLTESRRTPPRNLEPLRLRIGSPAYYASNFTGPALLTLHGPLGQANNLTMAERFRGLLRSFCVVQ